MNLFELGKKYDIEIKSKNLGYEEQEEAIDKLFGESMKVESVPTDTMLAIVRSLDSKCVKEENGIKYLDRVIRKLTLTTAFVSRVTDLDVRPIGYKDDDSDDSRSYMVPAYDEICRIGLMDYLRLKHWDIVSRFEDVVNLEEMVFEDKQRSIKKVIVVKEQKDKQEES